MLSSPSFKDSDVSKSYNKHMFVWPPVVVDKIMKKLNQLRSSNNCGDDHMFDQMVDVGCGIGNSTGVFSPYFRSILGCDISEEQIQQAKALNGLKNVKYVVGPGESLQVEDETVDLLICAAAFHYMDSKKSLKEFKRVLKPEGCVSLFSFDYKDINLDHEVHGENNKSGTEIWHEFYRRPFLKFIREADHPTNRFYDGMKKIYETISEFDKSRVNGIEFDWCMTLKQFRDFEKNLPANKSLEETIVGSEYPLDIALQKLKEFWEVEELGESDVHLRMRMAANVIFLNKLQNKNK